MPDPRPAVHPEELSPLKNALQAILLLPLRLAAAYAGLLARRWRGFGIAWGDRTYAQNRDLRADVVHPGPNGDVHMTFFVPNEVCRYRAETFSTKEPETLEWLDAYSGTGALYDIGANVGIYSIYFAKSHPGTVYAFEPSVLNLGLLGRNVSVNGVSSQVVIVPNPLTSSNQVADFHLSMLDEGGAMSTFGADFGHDGQPLDTRMEFRTAGMSLDFMLAEGLLPEPPALMKIDVDGIEHLILRGAGQTLRQPSLRSVLIEVDDAFTELASEVAVALEAAGFTLSERRRSEIFDGGQFATSYNQIWVRGTAHDGR